MLTPARGARRFLKTHTRKAVQVEMQSRTALAPSASSSCAHLRCARGAARACPLAFGTFFSKERSVPLSASYVTIWLGTKSRAHGYDFNPFWHGRMLQHVKAHNSTAVYYAYVIAMLARHMKGIQDCDVGSPSLCVHGADFVREHEQLILDTYESYANQTARMIGRHAPVVWLMEPDWHQYSEPTQHGGGLSQSRMVWLFAAMVGRIKRHLPASRISLDVSPWVANVGEWMGKSARRQLRKARRRPCPSRALSRPLTRSLAWMRLFFARSTLPGACQC